MEFMEIQRASQLMRNCHPRSPEKKPLRQRFPRLMSELKHPIPALWDTYSGSPTREEYKIGDKENSSKHTLFDL
ncbi:hypothetical protein FH972_012867 [Carpinus fangiana]|uniref:Uncharacterized protein n=1 Tax=Carpinus fangiana TaxID=176857 RepID=A0A5N6R4Z3_9ROSI|nr:hypothetical protein FH972_012867 [Carpinus fangiana]